MESVVEEVGVEPDLETRVVLGDAVESGGRHRQEMLVIGLPTVWPAEVPSGGAGR